jgi:hypothetical protein
MSVITFLPGKVPAGRPIDSIGYRRVVLLKYSADYAPE